MPRAPRIRIAKGIYQVANSLSAKLQVGSGAHVRSAEKAFPLETPFKEIEKWKKDKRAELRLTSPQAIRGTLARDVESYLERMRKRPASLAAKRSELKQWTALYGHIPRARITPAMIDQAIVFWLEGSIEQKRKAIAPKTIVNRCRTLRHLYVVIEDDKKARTPLDNIDLPNVPKRRPVLVSASTIKAVEKKLKKGTSPKAHARFMVLASTGIRPSQMKRLQPIDVDLKHGLVLVPGGKGGEPIAQVLNDDMKAAWLAYVKADAWGGYDSKKFAKRVRAAGWPPGVRVYNAKHSVGIELAERGADSDDIRAWMGHTDHATTRIYTGVPLARMKRLSEQLAGRLGWGLPRSGRSGDSRTRQKHARIVTSSPQEKRRRTS